MKNAEAVSGIIHYLNQSDLKNTNPDSLHDRPLYIGEEGIYANYAGFRLGSLFQPIIHIADAHPPKIIAYEALLAAHTAKGSSVLGSVLSTESIFSQQAGNNEITTLDRLARTLHALNFLLEDFSGNLHLNVHPLHMLAVSTDHGQVFEKILRQCGLDPSAIVLEIPEYNIREKNRLRQAIQHWQSRGYKIAIDQLGHGHTQFDRVFELKPDLVKVSRSLIQSATEAQRERELLQRLLETAAKHRIQPIACGVETADQQSALLALGFTHLQGYFYGRPAQHCAPAASDDDAPTGIEQRIRFA